MATHTRAIQPHMLLTDALQFLAQALYVVLFGVTLAQALSRPDRVRLEIALFFGTAAVVVALVLLSTALGLGQAPPVMAAISALVMVLPYLLLRLAAAFSSLDARYTTAAAVGLVATIVALVIVPQPYPLPLILTLVVYFVVVAVGASLVFVAQAGQTTGVTRRRLQCVAWGSAVLGLEILIAGLESLFPAFEGFWSVLGALCGLASGVLYFVGFAPPNWLRRLWQEPALRAFLARSALVVRESDTVRALHDLEDRAATALGSYAAVGLWMEPEGRLRFYLRDSSPATRTALRGDGVTVDREQLQLDLQPGVMIAGQAFALQQAIFAANATRDDPDYAAFYQSTGSRAALAAPITAGSRRLGVLIAYASRAPVFADSDLELVRLLADQAAVVLQSRVLIEDAARARAREEADQLKDDFLASISHDLRNPLTAVHGVAQVLERRLERNAHIEPERLAASLHNIRASAEQMAGLIDQLLDYARLQMDRPLDLLLLETDLVELARRTVNSVAAGSDRHLLVLDAPSESIVGRWDAARLERVIQNLVGNAIKYSPQGGEVLVRVMTEATPDGGWAVLSVQDHGVGIPAADLPHVFDRFHRAANVAEIRGTGLGLAAARQVLEQHGGSISVTSTLGEGSTFVARLPCQHEARHA